MSDLHSRDGYTELVHRPPKGTELKNGEKGERPVSLVDPEVRILSDYINENRPEVTDEYDRKPLFSTQFGRAHRNKLRGRIYKISRPCVYK